MLACGNISNEDDGEVANQLYMKTISTHKDIRNTRVAHFWYAGLLLVIKRNVAHIGLHLVQGECESVMRVVFDCIVRRELEKIVRFYRDDVGD